VLKTEHAESWDGFLDALRSIENEYGLQARGERQNTILYRGHADSAWPLKTTLERFSDRQWSFLDYSNATHACLPQLESYLERSFAVNSSWPELRQELRQAQSWPDSVEHRSVDPSISARFRIPTPIYSYWIYLRHHGFPSPLLDWTRSPFVAAFFAFEQRYGGDQVAVLAYIERTDGGKGGLLAEPWIRVEGPYVRTHKRHFLQQSWYSTATQPKGRDFSFVPHESVFDRGDDDQDVLMKITIPRSVRKEALAYLYKHNISSFSLFDSEESLASTLAYLELEGRG